MTLWDVFFTRYATAAQREQLENALVGALIESAGTLTPFELGTLALYMAYCTRVGLRPHDIMDAVDEAYPLLQEVHFRRLRGLAIEKYLPMVSHDDAVANAQRQE